MSKNGKLVLGLIILVIVITILPLIMIKDSEFGGTDGEAEELIQEMNPHYEPWVAPIIELPGGEMESLLFCVQASIGASVLGFGFGYLVARKKYKVS